MSFGNKHWSFNSVIDLQPFILDPLSRKAKNQTTFRKFLEQENRKFEVVSFNMNQKIEADYRKQKIVQQVSQRYQSNSNRNKINKTDLLKTQNQYFSQQQSPSGASNKDIQGNLSDKNINKNIDKKVNKKDIALEQQQNGIQDKYTEIIQKVISFNGEFDISKFKTLCRIKEIKDGQSQQKNKDAKDKSQSQHLSELMNQKTHRKPVEQLDLTKDQKKWLHKRYNTQLKGRNHSQNSQAFIFDVVSRDKRQKVQSPDPKNPPIGHYSPNYDFIKEKQVYFPQSTQNKAFLSNQPNSPQIDDPFTNPKELNCSKFEKQFGDLTKQFNSLTESYSKPQTPENNVLNTSTINFNETATSSILRVKRIKKDEIKSIAEQLTPQSPLLLLQKKIEHLYGKKIRNMSPIANESDFLSKYEKLIEVNDTLKDLPNIDFSKQQKKEDMIYKMTQSPNNKRFESLNKFPSILSQNTKLSVNMDLKLLTGRTDFLSQMGVSKDIHNFSAAFYDKQYTQIEKRVTGINFSPRKIENSLQLRNKKREKNNFNGNEFYKINHQDFKPKIKLKREDEREQDNSKYFEIIE
eukprot:403334100